MASHAKACILLEQAFELENRASEGLLADQNFLGLFNNLAALTARFISELPSLQSLQESKSSLSDNRVIDSKKRILLVMHTIARVALIKLYSLYESSNSSEPSRSRQFQLKAAEEAARMIVFVDLQRTAFIDPIMAVSPCHSRILN
jgi:hypothetical protein